MATIRLTDKPDAPGMDKAVVIYGGKVYLADAETIREALQCLPLEGGTMTGALILADNPTEDMEAATKRYVDGLRTMQDETAAELGLEFGASVDDGILALHGAIGDISTALDMINGEVV